MSMNKVKLKSTVLQKKILSALFNSTKKYVIWRGVEFRVAFSKGGSGVCPDEMVELSGMVELPVIELTSVDCTVTRFTLKALQNISYMSTWNLSQLYNTWCQAFLKSYLSNMNLFYDNMNKYDLF